MGSFMSRALEHAVDRRTFLKWGAAATATATVALAGSESGLIQVGTPVAEAAGAESEGKWISAACWHNCGGRCVNKVLVKEGVVIRQKTDDSHADSPDFPQQRGCARGRSQRQQVLGADRLKYPMKRKNWAPGGGKKELRGKDEWVRISWDEALDIVASEIKRAMAAGGNKAIMLPSSDSRLINALGGGITTWGVTSEGAWPQVETKMTGAFPTVSSDRMQLRGAKLIVVWSQNTAWSSSGLPTYNLLQCKKAGAKIIFVDPMYGATAQALADEWIPVRPGTDAALLIGMAHYMITNNLQDQAFLDKYTVGFDKDHMPEGADPKENFKDYVLGTYDGIPKTPEWASAICGTPADVIRHFAHECATTKPMIWNSSAAASRTSLGQQYCQAYLTVGWMTGNVGLPGAGIMRAYHSRAYFGTKPFVSAGGTGVPALANPLHPYETYTFSKPEKTDWFSCAYEEMYDAILKGEMTLGQRGKTKVDIKMLYLIRNDSGGNFLNQRGGINKGIEAVRKVDFFVTSDIVLSTVSKYADVVLPECTWWEKAGAVRTGNPEALFYQEQVMEPLYEAKEGNWIERELAKRLGLDPDKVHPLSLKQQFFNQIAGCKAMKEDGTGAMEPVVTITQADIDAMGVQGKPQQGRISLADFRQHGVYQVKRAPGDKLSHIAFKEFRDDPVKNPLKTKTGKLEIHCQPLSDVIKAYGFTTTPPIAQYRRPDEGYEETFADWEKKVKGEFPLQLFTIHYPRRSHSVFDNVRQLREAFPQEFFMNPVDAAARGLKAGDTVLVTSKHGKVLRPLYLTERIMPGVVTLGEGAWVEKDDETGIDKAGATNSLCGARLTGQGEEPWNTTIVQVEKWTGEPLPSDHTWAQRIIF
ncbi:MAG TPA: molybdopterin-dependent oxidoreductase [Symbiobacteriaceae bacterium]|nr:molybdopterin-dependent oxidoreductase [Symbiobacteriaceae bacterium]